MFWNNDLVEDIVKRSLKEDLGTGGDITSHNLLASDNTGKGIIIAKEKGVIAGLAVAEMVFNHCNQEIYFKSKIKDGEKVTEGDILAEIKGSTRDILKGERTALNFLQRLSGIATRTQQYVAKIKDYSIRITDTRKTTPNLRILEKYAVTAGGGYNHRMGLYDAVMIKDNHIKAAGGIKKAVNIIKEKISHTTTIEVEVEDMKGVKEAISAAVDIIMLDNMNYQEMKSAVDYIRKEDKKMIIEASGGITLDSVEAAAETGVDIISIGALTHQINSLDISLDLTPEIEVKKDI